MSKLLSWLYLVACAGSALHSTTATAPTPLRGKKTTEQTGKSNQPGKSKTPDASETPGFTKENNKLDQSVVDWLSAEAKRDLADCLEAIDGAVQLNSGYFLAFTNNPAGQNANDKALREIITGETYRYLDEDLKTFAQKIEELLRFVKEDKFGIYLALFTDWIAKSWSVSDKEKLAELLSSMNRSSEEKQNPWSTGVTPGFSSTLAQVKFDVALLYCQLLVELYNEDNYTAARPVAPEGEAV